MKQAKEIEKEQVIAVVDEQPKEPAPESTEEPIVEPSNEIPTVVESNNNKEDELILKDEEFEDIGNSVATVSQDDSKNEDNDANIEDSLNLTIGEEEEQLLRDDDDMKSKGNIYINCFMVMVLTFLISTNKSFWTFN